MILFGWLPSSDFRRQAADAGGSALKRDEAAAQMLVPCSMERLNCLLSSHNNVIVVAKFCGLQHRFSTGRNVMSALAIKLPPTSNRLIGSSTG